MKSVDPCNELRNTAQFASPNIAEMQSWSFSLLIMHDMSLVGFVTRTMVSGKGAPTPIV